MTALDHAEQRREIVAATRSLFARGLAHGSTGNLSVRAGNPALGPAAEEKARTHRALLSNHGPIVAGRTLGAAMDAVEELEETAKLFLLLRGLPTRPLTPEQRRALADPRA